MVVKFQQKPPTIKSASDAARKKLDDFWNSKFPDGMGYIIEVPDRGWDSAHVKYGWLLSRPNGRTRYRCHASTNRQRGIAGWYTGKGYYGKGEKHRTFINIDEWRAELGKLGITPEC